MPTTITKIVDPDGTGDYTSLSAALAAQARDLVAADEIALFECTSSAGTADTTKATVTGFTTDATRYVIIQSSGANRHTGVWSNSKYRLFVNTDFLEAALRIENAYTRVIGIQAAVTIGLSHGFVINCPSAVVGISISKCVLRNLYTRVNGDFVATIINCSLATVNAFNNLLFNDASSINEQRSICCDFGSGTLTVENNTIINLQSPGGIHYGLLRDGGTCVARNNILIGHGNTSTYDGTFAAGTDNNTTDSTDDIGTGSNNHTSQTFTFTNAGAGDYSLASGDTGARDQGTTLATVTSGFTDDIVGTARDGSGAIDCGCFEFPSGVAIPVFMNQYRQRR